MDQASQKFPIYTLRKNGGYEAGTRIDTVTAYFSTQSLVRVELIEGFERIETERCLFGQVSGPRFEAGKGPYDTAEELCSKKVFMDGLKKAQAVVKAALSGEVRKPKYA